MASSDCVVDAYPEILFMFITDHCNLKCKQCDYHKKKKYYKEPIDIIEKLKVIRETAKINKNARISFTGGEPFMKKRELYCLIEECSSFGIESFVTTNGVLIQDEDIDKIIKSGLKSIMISIDSHKSEVHDNVRGIPGTFNKVVSISQKLIERKNEVGSNLKVYASIMLGKHNLSVIDETVEFISGLGFDGLYFQPIQPNFTKDEEFNKEFYSDLFPTKDIFECGMEKLQKLSNSCSTILQTEEHLQDIREYFRHPETIGRNKCNSMKSTIIIDNYGETLFCFSMSKFNKTTLGNIKDSSIQKIWCESTDFRDDIKNCNDGCGIMNCHYKEE